MNIFLAFISGLVCKLYDDLDDNIYLKQFKEPTLMELLKGSHYICATALSILDPLFFIISYLGNFLHNLKNNESFKKPYEASLLYSCLIMFFVIDYKKIGSLTFLDYFCISWFLFWMFMEPLLKFPEVSYNKFYFRFIGILLTFVGYFIASSNTFKNIMVYVLGYGLISLCVQYYSLQHKNKNKSNKNKNKTNKNKNKSNKNNKIQTQVKNT
jgi:hypothetical protein